MISYHIMLNLYPALSRNYYKELLKLIHVYNCHNAVTFLSC